GTWGVDVDLQTAANLAEVLGVVIVLVGSVFAIIQLAHLRQQRRDMAAIELARSFQSPEFGQALRLLMSLPAGLSAEEFEEHGEAFLDAAMLVSLTVESVGIMVHRGVVEFDMVWGLMGGLVLGAWDRVEGWVVQVRREQGREKFDEWFQWLADRMRECEAAGEAPAYQRFEDWRPSFLRPTFHSTRDVVTIPMHAARE
ncbi:MAG: DUF4760 domain-containing protein, partial [marine benthic group bacterium]|nr:DUF4760 domain-containing protein [Gemmatimonadota bacterium]MCL7982743.1 DUF4760 domain-containing protein [Gemmatimonadota bacterium]